MLKPPDLIAIDGSPGADAAARYAIADARHDGRSIVFVHVIDGANPQGDVTANPSLDAALASSTKAGVSAEVRIVHGPPCEEIMAAVRDLGPRFIFVGTSGVSGFARALLGSVTADLLRLGDKPMVVIPPTATPKSSGDPLFARILVAVDPESEKASPVESAIALAVGTARELVFCAIVDESRFLRMASESGGFGLDEVLDEVRSEALRRLDAAVGQASANGVSSTTLLIDGTPATAICAAADEQRVTSIVMGTHGRKGLARMFLGSTTEEVLGKSVIPVLAFRPGHVIRNAGSDDPSDAS